MKVKKLIALLKKMPQDLDVFYSCHDNAAWELADVPRSVSYGCKSDYVDDVKAYGEDSQRMFERNPEEWVVIRS